MKIPTASDIHADIETRNSDFHFRGLSLYPSGEESTLYPIGYKVLS
ncbi:MAG: hypothetical protein JWM11_5, partial [Planctomycetaceae bacterium]|nr:hypothetical protein [Planctomycetaceae bacterium]